MRITKSGKKLSEQHNNASNKKNFSDPERRNHLRTRTQQQSFSQSNRLLLVVDRVNPHSKAKCLILPGSGRRKNNVTEVIEMRFKSKVRQMRTNQTIRYRHGSVSYALSQFACYAA